MYLQTGDCLHLRMARSVLVLGALISLLTPGVSSAAGEVAPAGKLDTVLRRLAASHGAVRVIVRATNVAEVETQVAAAGGRIGRRLTGINAVVVEVPYGSTDWLVREILKGAGDLVALEPDDAREAVLAAVSS